jgi:hypothetical protein
MNSPVSVVGRNYNHAKYLHRCLRSILDQKRRCLFLLTKAQSPESPIIFDAVGVSSAKDESVLKFNSPIALKIA